MSSRFEEAVIYALRDEYSWSDVFDREEVFDDIARSYDPEDIFSKKDLENWAENNGYIKE